MIPILFDDLHRTMPWDEIDAVVFDVGNVLITFSPEDLLRRHLPDWEAQWPRIMERVFRSPYWCMLDRGLGTLEELAERMIGPWEDLREPITRIMRGWPDLRDPVPEGVEALRVCREHGKRTYVLSNYHHQAFALVRDRFELFRDFDGMAVSGELHLCKPEAGIYRWLQETYRLDPERLLFLDDSQANVEAALNLGWNALCYNRRGKLAEFFGFEMK